MSQGVEAFLFGAATGWVMCWLAGTLWPKED